MSRAGPALVAACALIVCGPGASGETPEIDYMLQCQGCHLPDGSGSEGAVPDLRNFVGRFLEVEGGREYLVRVPGSAQSPLDDNALAALLNWMITRFGPASVAADFTPYTAAEVAALRNPPLTDVETLRATLVRELAK